MGAISQFVLRMAHESPALMLMASTAALLLVLTCAGLGAAARPAGDAELVSTPSAVAQSTSGRAAASRRPLWIASVTWSGVSRRGRFSGGSDPTGPPLAGTGPSGRSVGNGHVLYSWSHRFVQRPTPGGSPGGARHRTALRAALPVQSPAEMTVLLPAAGEGAAACAGAGSLVGRPGARLGPTAAAEGGERAAAAASACTFSATARVKGTRAFVSGHGGTAGEAEIQGQAAFASGQKACDTPCALYLLVAASGARLALPAPTLPLPLRRRSKVLVSSGGRTQSE